MMAEATLPEKPKTRIRLVEAAEMLGIGYKKIRSMAVDQHEFTVIRDAPGKGNLIFVRRDEVKAYDEGGLDALRKFRARMGRTK